MPMSVTVMAHMNIPRAPTHLLHAPNALDRKRLVMVALGPSHQPVFLYPQRAMYLPLFHAPHQQAVGEESQRVSGCVVLREEGFPPLDAFHQDIIAPMA